MELHILYEDRFVVVVNKPAGMLVHADGRDRGPKSTVVDCVNEQYPELAEVGEDMTIKIGDKTTVLKRPGIVHRLDRDTTGALIICKTQESFLHLKSQFQNHSIQKTYLAFCYGWPKPDQGSIDQPIGRSRGDFRKWSASRGARGTLREATTDWRVLKRFTADDRYSLFQCQPKTGRTHQIRVHLKYLNHPIVADTTYAGKLTRQGNLGFERQALHAWKINFTTPDDQVVEVMADLPDDFAQVVAEHGLGKYLP